MKKQTFRPTEWIRIDPPFSNIPGEQLIKHFDTIGKVAEEEYRSSQNAILEIVKHTDKLRLIANVSVHFFLSQSANAPIKKADLKLLQHHTELLQALALRISDEETTQEIRVAEATEKIVSLLKKNAGAYSMRQYSESSPQPDARYRLDVVEQMRAYTQCVRNEWYPHQLFRYLDSIFCRIDDRFESVYGIRASRVHQIIRSLISLVESRLNNYMKQIRIVAKAKTIDAALRAYVTSFPEYAHRIPEIAEKMKHYTIRPEHIKYFLIEESENILVDAFTISQKDISEVSNYECAHFCKILEHWSLGFGELENTPIDHIYMDNPVWTKPFVRLQNGDLFLACPGAYFSFAFDVYRELLQDSTLFDTYNKARSKLLEEEVHRLLCLYFRDAIIHRNLKWVDSCSGREYENDFVVLVDNHALLLEVKAGHVSAPARRGGELGLQRDIKELMVRPSEQSQRLMERLLAEKTVQTFAARDGSKVLIDSTKIQIFIRLNVTLQIIGSLTSRWPALKDAKIIEGHEAQTQTMSLSDLDTVFDVLQTQASICHYLRRRENFERHAYYVADELDLLVFYLDNGFNIGEAEFDGANFMIYGMSDDLAYHYERHPDGRRGNRPQPKRTQLWKYIVNP